MNIKTIEALASGSKQSKEVLENTLIDLKAKGATLLQCIVFVHCNQGCGLFEAKSVVINSVAWAMDKEGFLAHQRETAEEFMNETLKDADSLQMKFTPKQTETQLNKKDPQGLV